MPTRPVLAAYVAALLVMLAGDALWLGVIAVAMYQRGIGHLMAERPGAVAAALFYLLYAGGLVFFAIEPMQPSDPWQAAGAGALLGLVAYGTYDLSNLATLRGWPAGLAAIEMAWGAAISALAAGLGRVAAQRFGGP